MSTPNQEQLYYCSINGNESGPFNAVQLKQLVEEGRLSKTDSVRRKQSMNWHSAVEIKWLFSEIIPPPKQQPPTPPSVQQQPKQMDSGMNSRPGQTKPEEYFYYDSKTAERKGPYNQQELKSLAEKRTIKKNTILETPDGKTVEAGNVTWIWEDIEQKKIGEILPKISLLERIPVQKIAAAVLVLFAVFAAVFAFQWLFSGGSFEIDKPASGLIAKADKGNPRACVQLINYYMLDEPLTKLAAVASGNESDNEIGTAANEEMEKIVEKIRKYAKKGAKGENSENPYTQICKGYAYLVAMNDSGNTQQDNKDNLERALKAFYKAAEADSSEGSAEGSVVFAFLINMLLTGRELRIGRDDEDISEYAKKYKEQAEEWLSKAAERGHARAQFLLGIFYIVGSKIGITKDDQEAMTWIYKAAAQRNALINNTALGFAAAFLEDVSERDAKRAFALLYKRANGGWLDLIYKRKPAKEELPNLAVLQSFIAYCYDEGIGGVNENKAKAFEWYKKAAEADTIKLIANDAQFHIAQAYDNGEGVSEDKMAAFKQYRKAADTGNILAQYRLAQMYDEGEGVKEDRDEAKIWYRKVLDNRRGVSPLLDFRNMPGGAVGAMITIPKSLRNKIDEELQRIRIAIENAGKKAG